MKRSLLALCLALALVGWLLVENPMWLRVEHFDVEPLEGGKEEVLFERIRSALQGQLKVFQGRYVWQVPISLIYEQVLKDKRVRSAIVFRDFPARVRIQIEPRTPVLAYLDRDGRLYPVAADATLLPALPAREAPDLPILRGDLLRDEFSLREQAIDLFNLIPDEGLLRKANVSEILYSGKEGFKIFVSGASSEVQFGVTDFGPKVSRVQKVLSYLDSQSIKGRVIDARFSKKVVVRVRNTP